MEKLFSNYVWYQFNSKFIPVLKNVSGMQKHQKPACSVFDGLYQVDVY